MKLKTLLGAGAAATLLVASVAFAQTVPSSVVGVTSNPLTGSVSANTAGAALGTFTLSGPSSGNVSIASIPLTLTASGGATASNLSNCQVFNSAGTVLASGSNVGTIQSGSNTVVFNQPLQLGVGSGNTTYTVRCDVASGTPSSNLFQFTAGAPTYAPGLMVGLYASPSATIGTNASLAVVTLDATRSGQNVRVSSLPLVITAGAGNTTANLSNCAVRAAANVGSALNTGANAVGSFVTGPTITLDSPLTIPAGSATVLALTCNVSANAPVGATYIVSLSPGNVPAVNASTGAAITPAVGLTTAGTAAPTVGTVVLSSVATGGTPGLPSTGTGGNAAVNIALLALMGIVALFGAALYLRFASRH